MELELVFNSWCEVELTFIGHAGSYRSLPYGGVSVEGSLSWMFLSGGPCPGGLCPGVSVKGGLCLGCLCPGVSLPGGLCQGVSVQGVSVWASLSRGSLSGGSP